MEQVKIGRFIAELRKQRGLTQAKLGEMLGVTNKTVSRWENGNYMPEISLIPDLADKLGISINELMAGERFSEHEYRRGADEQLLKNMQLLEEIREIKDNRWLSQGVGEIGLFIMGAVYIALWFHAFGWQQTPKIVYACTALSIALTIGGIILLLVMKRPRPLFNLSTVIGVAILPLGLTWNLSEQFTWMELFMPALLGLALAIVGMLGNRIYFRAIDKLLTANMKTHD